MTGFPLAVPAGAATTIAIGVITAMLLDDVEAIAEQTRECAIRRPIS